MKIYSIFLITLFLFSFPIFSETILLKGNESIRGKIKNQSINSIKVEVNGAIVEISKDRILKIVYLDLTKSDEAKIRAEEEKANEELPPLKKEEEKKNRGEDNTKLAEEQKTKPESIEDAKSNSKENVEPQNKEQQTVTKEKEEPVQKNHPSRLEVTLRSALIPGWGQFTEKRNFPGIAYPTIILGLSGLILNENKKHQNSMKQYNSFSNPILLGGFILNSTDPPSPPENTLMLFYSQRSSANNSHVGTARNFSYALIGIYLWNIIDAYIFYNENAFTENKTRGFYMDYELRAFSSQISISHSSLRYDQVYTGGYTIRY